MDQTTKNRGRNLKSYPKKVDINIIRKKDRPKASVPRNKYNPQILQYETAEMQSRSLHWLLQRRVCM